MSLGKISKRNNTFTAFRYKIVAANVSARRFFVHGDQTHAFKAGDSIRVGASVANNGTYTVASSAFDTSTNRTRVNVDETLYSSTVDGVIDLLNREIPWITGDTVVLNSTKFLPTPLYPNRPYYVIRKSTSRFQLAETYQDALALTAIEFSSPGDGFLTVAEVESTFRVFGGAGNTSELWFHYAIDETDVRVFNPPQTILGMQTLINMVDGYARYQNEAGLIQNIADSNDFDPITGRLVTWQLETERFIDWAFGLRSGRMVISDSYPVVATPSSNTLTFTSAVPMWLSGTAVTLSSTGSLPSPLIAGSKYHVVLTGTPGEIKVSTSPTASDLNAIVELSTAGSGIITIGMYDKQRAFPRFELNPTRNNAWIDTPLGVLSNVIEGPYSDIRIQQTIFDQYNRPINSDNLTVYREDKRSRIAIRPEIANTVDPIYANDPYNYIHMGGGHFFVEGYEHFLLLNNYTVSGALLYDPFLGLSTNKYNVDYFEKTDYTLRPTLGGYFLIDGKFLRNMEGSTTDVQNFYDILTLSEATTMAKHARSLIGYKGRSNFLDLLNVNSKSQLLFYRGMIQAKGSINSVKAYINSRRFVDAKLDEFWAWKLADFGDARPKIYPEINLFINDGRDDIRFEFQGEYESTAEDEILEAEYEASVQKGFKLTTFKDEVRWYNHPDQKQKVGSPLFLDAEVTSMISIHCSDEAPEGLAATIVNYWFNTDTNMLYALDTDDGTWTVDSSERILVNGSTLYFIFEDICEGVRVTNRTITEDQYDTSVEMVADTDYQRINAYMITFPLTALTNIVTIFTINPAASKISPAHLLDKDSNTIIQNVPIWHPALDKHHPQAVRGIKFDRPTDPAHYTTTLNFSSDNLNLNAWNHAEAGTVWWDTSRVQHESYYDDKINPNINDRLRTWGNLAPWADMKVYQWVQSTIPPSQWDAAVVNQTADSSIPHDKKATGTPRKTVFKRTREQSVFTIDDSRVVAPEDVFTEGDVVLFVSDGTLPTGIEASTRYVVTNISAGTTFDLIEFDTDEAVTILSEGGTDPMYIVPVFTPTDWKKYTFKQQRVTAPVLVKKSNELASISGTFTFPYAMQPSGAPRIAWTPADIDEWETAADSDFPDVVDVYVNYIQVAVGLPVQRTGDILYVILSTPLVVAETNVIDIIRPLHTLTREEAEFDPDTTDDGTEHIQWKEDYEYTLNVLTTGSGYVENITRTYYYFWIENATTRDTSINGSLSIKQIASYLTETPSPYMIVQKPKDDYDNQALFESTDFALEPYKQMPVMYRQLILHNVAPYIDDDARYTLQFTRDFSMRDTLQEYHRNVNVKDVHQQWVLFRKEQTSAIDYELWDKLTESLVGYRINNLGDKTRVPSLERELYDATYNTATRIGMLADQTFVDKALGLNTILRYLKNPNYDFSPASIDDFFAHYKFDTPENIRIAMDVIYNTFDSTHVNAMWFEVLQDSFSQNRKYQDIMKTSWVALHGVRVLEVGGIFDD